MYLAKLVQTIPLENGGTTTRVKGWYLITAGECIRVELWNVYQSRVMKTPEEQKEEDAKTNAKQRNNWRKLEKVPYKTCEGKEDLFALIEKSREEFRKNLAKESKGVL